MKRMGNYQWPLMPDASLDSGCTSEKWPLAKEAHEVTPGNLTSFVLDFLAIILHFKLLIT